MKNITLAVDEKVLKKARSYATRRGTTVNAIVREHLSRVVDEESRIEEARSKLLDLIDNSSGRLGPDYEWNREDIYADRVFPRHKHSGVRRGRKAG
jgi:hypothetical protein